MLYKNLLFPSFKIERSILKYSWKQIDDKKFVARSLRVSDTGAIYHVEGGLGINQTHRRAVSVRSVLASDNLKNYGNINIFFSLRCLYAS